VYPDLSAPIYPPGSLTQEEMDKAMAAERERQLKEARYEVKRMVIAQHAAKGATPLDEAALEKEVDKRMEVVQSRTSSLSKASIRPTSVGVGPAQGARGASLGIGPRSIDLRPQDPLLKRVAPTKEEAARAEAELAAARGFVASQPGSERSASSSSSSSKAKGECTSNIRVVHPVS